MGTITVSFNDLKSAIEKTQKISEQMRNYEETVQRQLNASLNALPGSDAQGNISGAARLAGEKARLLRQKSEELNFDSMNLKKFYEHAQSADLNVSRKIKELAEPFLARVPYINRVGNMMYQFFCGSVKGWIEKNIPFGSYIVDMLRNTHTFLTQKKEKIRDWFKYGDGMYIAHVVEGVKKIVSALVTVVGIATTAPAWLGVAAIAVGAVVLCLYLGDLAVTEEQNRKALSLSRQGDKGLARYYGNITNVRSYTERYDFGSAYANKALEVLGAEYQAAETTTEYLLDTIGIANTAIGLGKVKGYDAKAQKYDTLMNYDLASGGKTYIYDFSYSNIKNNIILFVKDNLRNFLGKDSLVLKEEAGEYSKAAKKFNDFLSKGEILLGIKDSGIDKLNGIVNAQAETKIKYSVEEGFRENTYHQEILTVEYTPENGAAVKTYLCDDIKNNACYYNKEEKAGFKDVVGACSSVLNSKLMPKHLSSLLKIPGKPVSMLKDLLGFEDMAEDFNVLAQKVK